MNEIMIKMENLGKKFGDLWAVRNLNLQIYRGEVFAFLGPNGAGKTTTIKLLTGLLKPTEGRAEIAGYDVQKQPLEAKRHLSYIPDEPYLYEKLTGREFLEFVAQIYGMRREEYIRKIDYFIDFFQMHEYVDELIEDYSHGMRQKLVFSSAFLHDPDVMVIDEPLVGLDPASARKLKQILKQKAGEGMTFFISTHTLSFAEEIATRIGIIDKGELIAVGTQDELKRRAGLEGKLEEIFLKITEEALDVKSGPEGKV